MLGWGSMFGQVPVGDKAPLVRVGGGVVCMACVGRWEGGMRGGVSGRGGNWWISPGRKSDLRVCVPMDYFVLFFSIFFFVVVRPSAAATSSQPSLPTIELRKQSAGSAIPRARAGQLQSFDSSFFFFFPFSFSRKGLLQHVWFSLNSLRCDRVSINENGVQ